MNQEQTQRFQGADWFGHDKIITVGGAGSIGSWLLLFISRMGHNIILYEYDRVEANNIGGQLYREQDIGNTKASSISSIVLNFSPATDLRTMGEFEVGNLVSPVAFSCFDNMEARRNMFEVWKSNVVSGDPEEDMYVFIDGRLTAESFQMYIVTPDRTQAYEDTLFEDSDIEDLPCSFKSTSHVAAMLASQMSTALTNAITNFHVGNIRDIPFETKFEGSLFLYEQQFEPEREQVNENEKLVNEEIQQPEEAKDESRTTEDR